MVYDLNRTLCQSIRHFLFTLEFALNKKAKGPESRLSLITCLALPTTEASMTNTTPIGQHGSSVIICLIKLGAIAADRLVSITHHINKIIHHLTLICQPCVSVSTTVNLYA